MSERIGCKSFAHVVDLVNKSHCVGFSSPCVSIHKYKPVIVDFVCMNSFNDLLNQLTTPDIKDSLGLNKGVKYMIKSVDLLI
jgi:hypothetical protein